MCKMFLKCLVVLLFCNFIDAQFYRERCPYPHIAHGTARVKQRYSFAKFTCNQRYTLVGNRYATCRHGQWDVPFPTCVKTGCPPLDPVQNAVTQSLHNNAWVLYFCYPGHELVGSPVIFCDGRKWNDTTPRCVESNSMPKTSCDFEDSNLCGWTHDELHDFDWKRFNLRTPSSFLLTGPRFDHTFGRHGNGYYMYIEGSSQLENDTARLISPVMDKNLAIDGCFVLYYHMYGRDIGGLRVYQKPDNMSMNDLLHYSENGTNKYKIFELWGNQGNFWFPSVSSLLDVSDDFQIVIEGIRGKSFMSDIAIDDVSIQQGENCTNIRNKASTPVPKDEGSCVDRCGMTSDQSSDACDCSIVCMVYDSCCLDYLETCEFNSGSNTTDDVEASTLQSTSVELPQTQKLVATTTPKPLTTTSISTTTSTSTTNTTPSTTTSTTPSTTTRKPKVVRTTARTKPTTVTTSTTTTRRPTTTTRRPTTTKVVIPTTKKYVTSTKPGVTSTKPAGTYRTPKFSPISRKWTTQATTLSATIKAAVISAENAKKKTENGGSSGALMAVVVLLILGVVCGALYAVYVLRTRGTYMLARLRARANNDAEVLFIGSDMDVDVNDE